MKNWSEEDLWSRIVDGGSFACDAAEILIERAVAEARKGGKRLAVGTSDGWWLTGEGMSQCDPERAHVFTDKFEAERVRACVSRTWQGSRLEVIEL